MTASTEEPARSGRPARRARTLPTRVALLDALPELADRLPADQQAAAARVGGRAIAVRRGVWDAAADAAAIDGVGFLVVSGTLARLIKAEHREAAQLLGPGDVVEPRRDLDARWRAVEDTTLVLLERRLLAEAAQVPHLVGQLLAAASNRTQIAARQLVIAQWSSVDERIVTVLELLAERWGVVTRDGLVLPDWLTHSLLAPLVGARRPSVTTALQRLHATGAVVRRPDGRWLLGPSA